MADQPEPVAQRIVRALGSRGPNDDDELAAILGRDRVHINQAARALEKRGVLTRSRGPSGKLVNTLVPGAVLPARPPRQDDLIPEDAVKRAVADHLTAQGYRVTVIWGRDRGIDIDAAASGGRLIIEAKGEAPAGPQQVNYFLNAIGELVQRVTDEEAE